MAVVRAISSQSPMVTLQIGVTPQHLSPQGDGTMRLAVEPTGPVIENVAYDANPGWQFIQ